MKRKGPSRQDGQRSLTDFFCPPAKRATSTIEPAPSTSDTVVIDVPDSTQSSESQKNSSRCADVDGSSSSSTSGVHPMDIGGIAQEATLSYETRALYVHDVWRPETHFRFPASVQYGRTRRFQHSWMQSYPWLTYSNTAENCGGFCVPCVLFCTSTEKSSLGQLITSPMVNLTRATTTLSEHHNSKTHKVSSERLATFLATEGRVNVQQQLLDHREGIIQKNIEKLHSLVKCIVFCGRQNIGLRGHRNESLNSWDPVGSEEPDSNPGNFLALVHFRAAAGDKALQHSFATGTDGRGTRKITYTTPRIQNEILDVLAEYVQGKIAKRIEAARFFFYSGR